MSATDEYAKLYQRGRRIVYAIAILNVAPGVFAVFAGGHILALVAEIILSIALCFGINWVRKFFVIFSAIGVIIALYELFTIPVLSVEEGVGVAVAVAWLVITVVLLGFNKNVDRFFKVKQARRQLKRYSKG